MKRLNTILFIAAYALSTCATAASGLDSLEAFVKTVHSGRAEFTQVVTAPAKEGQTTRSKTSSGTFEFDRPKHFKFIYKKPFEQSIVADGQTLWLFDADLNQVTARKQAGALGASPAALIAAAPDLHALQADFTLTAAPDTEGLQWVLATPKAKDGQLQSVRVGFRAATPVSTLAVLDMLDNFGQRSVLSFHQFEVNPNLNASAFAFKPPKGADVIKQ